MRDRIAWIGCQRLEMIAVGWIALLCALVAQGAVITNSTLLQGTVQRARAGEATALLALAEHLMAKGDCTNAAGWYRAGAERGLPAAQLAYAQCLAAGRGVKADSAEASRWSHLAANALSSTNSLLAATAAPAPTPPPVPVVAATSPAEATVSNASPGRVASLLAIVSPSPLKVSAREPVAPSAPVESSLPAKPPVPPVVEPATTSPVPPVELPPLRFLTDEIGDGIHFQRVIDLPPLAPAVQDEPVVIRPPEGFR